MHTSYIHRFSRYRVEVVHFKGYKESHTTSSFRIVNIDIWSIGSLTFTNFCTNSIYGRISWCINRNTFIANDIYAEMGLMVRGFGTRRIVAIASICVGSIGKYILPIQVCIRVITSYAGRATNFIKNPFLTVVRKKGAPKVNISRCTGCLSCSTSVTP